MTDLRTDGTLLEMYKAGLISPKPIFYLDIANQIVNKKLTQKQLAERLGVSTSTIKRAVATFRS